MGKMQKILAGRKVAFDPASLSVPISWGAVPLLLFLAGLVTYVNSFANAFMLDDYIVLFGQKGVASKTFLDLFTARQADFYRPIGHVPLWGFYRLFGDQVWMYHGANLLLFSAAVWLMFLIIVRLSSDRKLAFLTALLFTVHPLEGMLVNYVTANIITTFVICLELSFLAFLSFLSTGKKRWWPVSFVFFILAFLSHEMAVVFPLVLLLLLCLGVKKWVGVEKKDAGAQSSEVKGPLFTLLSLGPFFLVSVGYLVLRSRDFFFHRTIAGTAAAWKEPVSYFVTWYDLISWYVRKLFVPHELLFLWSVPFQAEFFFGKLIVFLGVCAFVGYLFWRWGRSLRSFALGMFLIGLAPTLSASFSYHPIVKPLLETHCFYFDSMGFFHPCCHGRTFRLAQALGRQGAGHGRYVGTFGPYMAEQRALEDTRVVLPLLAFP